MLRFQDFATPSLDSVDKTVGADAIDIDDEDDDGSDDEMKAAVEVAQLCLRRHWETRYEEIIRL